MSDIHKLIPVRPPFLQDIARHIFSIYKDNIQDICIVFPHKRARLYFNRYLSELTDKPVWAPSYYTINELMQHLSGLQVADPLTLIFDLYSAFKDLTKSSESFDDFYIYCEILLADFDDVDKYLIEPADIFKNLANLKNIENYFDYLSEEQIEVISRFWNTFSPKNISDDQKSFLSLWDSMHQIYRAFNNNLRNKNLAYEGMAYREVSARINSNILDIPDEIRFMFIGFNALNKCEKKLFHYLSNIGKAEFYWDYDSYYINNKIHEAGYFLRENIKEFPSVLSSLTFDSLTKQEKNISFISVPSNIGQAKIIPQCFRKAGMPKDTDLNKTVIVLADENLLLPVLNSIPEEINDINVSMGYPFKETSVFSLIENLVDLHRNNRKNNKGEIQFYYKDVISLLKLPVFNGIFQDEVSTLIQEITGKNKIFIKTGDLQVNNLLSIVFNDIQNPKNIPGYILEILDIIIESYKLKKPDNTPENKVEYDFIYNAYIYIQRLNEVLKTTQTELSAGTLFKLIHNLLKKLSIPFSGEPLAGLQVMGILETRALDFDNIIMLSMNEGIFPKTVNIPSFIPYSLRYGFEMPTSEHRDAIYAYYFYRLIQRAKNIFLVYNSRTEGLFTGERSRYLHQLFYESAFNISKESFSYDISPLSKKIITVKKKDSELNILEKYIEPGSGAYLSPSAINTYLNCPLRFYFGYVAGLDEPAEVSEEIDPALFGSILHKAINIIYEPYIGNWINEDILNLIRNDKNIVESAINEAFRNEYFRENTGKSKPEISGRNLIIKEVIHKYVNQILDVDRLYSPFKIVSLEQFYTSHIPIAIKNKNKKVNIGGKIDRIDEKDGKLRIIDYKTGQTKNSFKSIDTLFDNKGSERNNSAFQTLLYSLILSDNNDKDIIPGLYFMREIFNKDFDFRIIQKKGRNDTHLVNSFKSFSSEFSQRLQLTLEEIYNKNTDFSQTEDLKECEYCPYARICHRNGI